MTAQKYRFIHIKCWPDTFGERLQHKVSWKCLSYMSIILCEAVCICKNISDLRL